MGLTYNELSSVTQKLFMPKLIDNIFANNALLHRMKSKGAYEKIDGGASYAIPLLYAENAGGGWYSGADDLNVVGTDQITHANFDFKTISKPIVITGTEKIQNSGKSKIIDLVDSKIQAAEASLSKDLGTAMFAASTAAKSFPGFVAMTAVTGTYGEIDKATNSWWQGQVDSTSTVMTASGAFRSLVGDCTNGADKPTVAVTTQDIYNDIQNSIAAQQRYVDTKMAAVGFENISVDGVTVIVDNHVLDGYCFLINEKFTKFVVQKQRDFKFTGFEQPINQDLDIAKIFWMGSLVCSRPGYNGAFTAIA